MADYWADVIGTAEAADLLGVTPRRVKALCAAGLLDCKRIGATWAVSRASVAARAAAGSKPGRPRKTENG